MSGYPDDSGNANNRLNRASTGASIDALVSQLRDPGWVESQSAAKQLVALGEAAVPTLIGELTYPTSDVRRRAAQALGQIGDKRAVEPLLHVLAQDQDGVVRWVAALALGELAEESAIPALVNALTDEDWNAASAAGKALVRIGKPAVGPLIERLLDPDYRVRRHAAQALSEIADSRATQPLIAALEDEDSWVRFSAAEGLGAIGAGDNSVVDTLIRLLGDEDSEVRGVAVVALGKLGNPRALPALEQLADDTGATWDDRTIAEAAEEAKAQIEKKEQKHHE
jgi:HEAT repeat protein